MIEAREISQSLAAQAESVAAYLIPDGHKQGRDWCASDLAGGDGDSLKVCVQGARAGLWKDFADTARGGDLLDLWAACKRQSIPEAMRDAAGWLGLEMPSDNLRAPVRNYATPAKVPSEPIRSAGEGAIDVGGPGRAYLESRGISVATAEAYRLREGDDCLIFPYFADDELVHVKYRALSEKRFWSSEGTMRVLFGWQSINPSAREVVLTEGEIDALSVHEAGWSALSLPDGAGEGGKQRWLENDWDRLARFDTIYLCLDQDTAGLATIEPLLDRLGRHRCRVVKLPAKDANETLQVGHDLAACIEAAKPADPHELRSASYYMDATMRLMFGQAEQGLALPWGDQLQLRFGELVLLNGYNGHGKSQALNQMLLACMDQGERVCVASMELRPQTLLRRLLIQATAGAATSDETTARDALAVFDDRLWLFGLTGTAKSERLLEVMTYAHKRYGVRVFAIDSMLKIGLDEEDHAAEKAFIDRLTDFKNQYDVLVILVTHPRKGADETKPPGKMDVKGSGSITDLADTVFIWWRNRVKEQELQKARFENRVADTETENKPDALLICEKQRNDDWLGKVAVWWNAQAGQFVAKRGTPPRVWL